MFATTGQSKNVAKKVHDRMNCARRISQPPPPELIFFLTHSQLPREVALKMSVRPGSVVHAMRRAINELAPELLKDEKLAEARQYQKADKGRADASHSPSHSQRPKGLPAPLLWSLVQCY